MNDRLVSILSLVIAGLLLAILVIHFYDFTVDDAFITFRYARNFAAGDGLVFNIGERVEGYTNFLWLILLSLFIKFGLDPVVAAKMLGIIFAFLAILMLWSISRILLRDRPWLKNIPLLLLAASPSYAIYAVSGLETMLFCFLLLLAFRLFIYEEANINRIQISWAALFLLTLTRPEGFLFFVLFALLKFLPGKDFKRLLICSIPYLILLVLYLGWKIYYFGEVCRTLFMQKQAVDCSNIWVAFFILMPILKIMGG
jgi:hypothetical protein